MLIDLTEVNVIDHEGLSILRDVIRCVYKQGGQVALARPWRLATPLLGLVGTTGLIFLALSPAGAIAWLDQYLGGPQPSEESLCEEIPAAGIASEVPVTQEV